MFIGGHGYSHKWLNAIGEEEKKFESEKTYQFLESLGVDKVMMTMCYPYGGYDQKLIDIIRESGYKCGLSTDKGIAKLTSEARFKLTRIDTNEII